ncbi:restriction endonuclease subunit S [Priestia megaterium]|uniref:restriction endonuclease subunit S n=1 Tax=Priestia megaterium TaxID=1404 RepID=UPI002E1CD12D|nr:restriction endonuclease subunit S [Priestia megaterium]MED3855384.1 restriction endonuclease subunit S [Priestia megaterium]
MITTDSIFNIIEKPISGEWGKEPKESNAIRVIRTTNFTNRGKLDIENKEVVRREVDQNKIEKKKLMLGDIIIEKSGGSPTQPVGRVVYFNINSEEPILCNNFTSIIRVNPDKVSSKYLFYFMLYMHQLGVTKKYQNKTTGIINLKLDSYLKDTKIPLPSLEEQKRIVKILEKASLLLDQRRQSLFKLESFLKSSFLSLAGPNAEHESIWKNYKIQELAYNQKGSMRTGPFGSDLKHSEFVDEGICVLGIDNAVGNYFSWGERRYITAEKYHKLKRYTVYPDDVIITIMGTTGRSAVVPHDIPTAISTKHLATITLNKELALPEYISYAIHSHPGILKQISLQNKGAIMNGLNLGIIKNLELKVPPIEVQKKFKEVYKKVEKMRVDIEVSENYLKNLYNSLLQKAFNGELTKQKVG